LTLVGLAAALCSPASAGSYYYGGGYAPSYYGGYAQPCCNYVPPPQCCAAPVPVPYYAPAYPPAIVAPCYRQYVRIADGRGGWTWGLSGGCN